MVQYCSDDELEAMLREIEGEGPSEGDKGQKAPSQSDLPVSADASDESKNAATGGGEGGGDEGEEGEIGTTVMTAAQKKAAKKEREKKKKEAARLAKQAQQSKQEKKKDEGPATTEKTPQLEESKSEETHDGQVFIDTDLLRNILNTSFLGEEQVR